MSAKLQTTLDVLNKQIGSIATMIAVQPQSRSKDMLVQQVGLLSQLMLDVLNIKNKMDS